MTKLRYIALKPASGLIFSEYPLKALKIKGFSETRR
jgi:hypothetical protein